MDLYAKNAELLGQKLFDKMPPWARLLEWVEGHPPLDNSGYLASGTPDFIYIEAVSELKADGPFQQKDTSYVRFSAYSPFSVGDDYGYDDPNAWRGLKAHAYLSIPNIPIGEIA